MRPDEPDGEESNELDALPFARGQDRDFEELYAAHFHALTVQLYAYAGDMDQAREVVQEAFCRAYSRWKKISTYDDPLGWIRRVAWNLATSQWRRMRTAARFAGRYREEYASPPSPDRVAIMNALSTLPENQRRVVVLHYMADMAISDIAEQVNVSANTVKSWLHRGRAALAAQLAERKVWNV
jgi:RNA polymerase sigma-70 factor (ECF subfamily)